MDSFDDRDEKYANIFLAFAGLVYTTVLGETGDEVLARRCAQQVKQELENRLAVARRYRNPTHPPAT